MAVVAICWLTLEYGFNAWRSIWGYDSMNYSQTCIQGKTKPLSPSWRPGSSWVSMNSCRVTRHVDYCPTHPREAQDLGCENRRKCGLEMLRGSITTHHLCIHQLLHKETVCSPCPSRDEPSLLSSGNWKQEVLSVTGCTAVGRFSTALTRRLLAPQPSTLPRSLPRMSAISGL